MNFDCGYPHIGIKSFQIKLDTMDQPDIKILDRAIQDKKEP